MSWLKRKAIPHPLPPSRLPFFSYARNETQTFSLYSSHSLHLSRVCEELEKMGRQRAQLRAMLRKNWLLKIRHPFVTCAEVGCCSFGSVWLPWNRQKGNIVSIFFLFIFRLVPGTQRDFIYLIFSFSSLHTIRPWSYYIFLFKDRWKKRSKKWSELLDS